MTLRALRDRVLGKSCWGLGLLPTSGRATPSGRNRSRFPCCHLFQRWKDTLEGSAPLDLSPKPSEYRVVKKLKVGRAVGFPIAEPQ